MTTGTSLEWNMVRWPAEPGDGHLDLVADLVGDAEVIAWAEGPHHTHEFLSIRNDAIRFLVEHHGVTAVAAETSFTESFAADDYLLGAGPDRPDEAALNGVWSWGGPLEENRQLLAWLRGHNTRSGTARPIRFYGLDMCGAHRGRFPHARRGVDGALDYLGHRDAAAAAGLRRRFGPLLGRFASGTYAELNGAERDCLAGAVAGLIDWFDQSRRRCPSDPDDLAFARARHQAMLARHLDANFRSNGASWGIEQRDGAQADSLRWVLEREGPDGRIVVFEHVGHLSPTTPGSLGQRIRQLLGDGACFVGALWAGDTGAAVPLGPLEGLSRALSAAADGPGPYLVDLRPLQGTVVPAELAGPVVDFDAVVFVPSLTPAGRLPRSPAQPRVPLAQASLAQGAHP